MNYHWCFLCYAFQMDLILLKFFSTLNNKGQTCISVCRCFFFPISIHLYTLISVAVCFYETLTTLKSSFECGIVEILEFAWKGNKSFNQLRRKRGPFRAFGLHMEIGFDADGNNHLGVVCDGIPLCSHYDKRVPVFTFHSGYVWIIIKWLRHLFRICIIVSLSLYHTMLYVFVCVCACYACHEAISSQPHSFTLARARAIL